MKKKKKLPFIILISIALVAVLIIALTKLGLIDTATTYAESEANYAKTYKIDNLKDNSLYVWQNSVDKSIEDESNEFLICPKGNTNIDFDDRGVAGVTFTIWVPTSDDYQIPTLTSQDKLLYVSKSSVPDTFDFQRMYENGYSIGVTSFTADESDHYYINYMVTDKDDYKQFVNSKSDAKDLGGLSVAKLYLDKVGGMEVTAENVSDGGVVTGLTKDEQYICEFYTGTYYQDYLLTASEHTFTAFEDFTCYGYEFLHSNCISIDIPEWLTSGYYYINGIGLFRYVDDEDVGAYSGEPYDENIAWNEPLILYNEFGQVIYNPSLQTDEELTEEDAETEGNDAASAVGGTKAEWSYSLPEAQDDFGAQIVLSELANSDIAAVQITKPDGETVSFNENNNVIDIDLEESEAGAYAFSLINISGRSFTINYSTGDTYSGVGSDDEEPIGDETLDEDYSMED